MRNRVRNSLFRLARADVIAFLEDHEEDLLQVFREELRSVDERMPEEKMFIDIHMVNLGEELMIAVLNALKRFMREI